MPSAKENTKMPREFDEYDNESLPDYVQDALYSPNSVITISLQSARIENAKVHDVFVCKARAGRMFARENVLVE